MAFEDLELDGLGKEASARYEASKKAQLRADDMKRSAGLYLIEAKERVKKTKGLTWPEFLRDHFPYGARRADELIMIADGRVTVEELRETKATSVRKSRQKSAQRSAESAEKTKQKQQTDHQEPPWEEAVREAENHVSNRDRLLAELISMLKTYTEEQLEHAKVALSHV